MKKILLFASGSGTNVENIIQYFKTNDLVEISAVFCNNSTAKVLERAKNHQVSTLVFNRLFTDSISFFNDSLDEAIRI